MSVSALLISITVSITFNNVIKPPGHCQSNDSQ